MSGSRVAWLRWLLPAAAVMAVTAGAAVVQSIGALAPQLPARTAAELLTDLQTARLDGLSGTVTLRADLGLPSLPGIGGQGSSDLTSLISGTHTLRVWYSGPDSARVALLGTLGESDIITNGRDMWIWSSRDNTAVHRTLPAPRSNAPAPPLNPAALPKTPQEAAAAVLAALDPSTVVTTAGSARVAGRAAYELILAPRDKDSLISQVKVAIDAAEHLPLRVQVYPTNAVDPAIEVAFTEISFVRPGPEHFRFNPPPGAKVTEQSDQPAPAAKPDTDPAKAATGPAFVVIGSGWTTVLAARLGAPAATPASGGTADPGITGLLRRLPAVQGSWGSGRLLAGKLFSVLLIDDGRMLVGAVSPQRLYQAAADPATAPKSGP